MKFNYGFIVVNKEESYPKAILHFCGYEHRPTFHDYVHLKEELATDSEFSLTQNINKCDILEASKDVLDHYNKVYETDIKPQLKE
jgi:hypothetical protein